MTDEEKRLLQKELEKAGSIPALLKKMATSQSEEFRLLRQQIEGGPEHPSGEELYDYVLGWMDREHSNLIIDHLILCRKCLAEVIRIRSIEEGLTTDALARADKRSLISRIKNFVSAFSFPSAVQFLAFPPPRSTSPDSEVHVHAPGEPILLTLEGPADGYITILYCCEETGEVRLVFPAPGEDPKVAAGQEIDPITDEITGPAGKHYYKIFWTKDLLFDSAIPFDNYEQRLEAIDDFLDSLEDLHGEDWRAVTHEFQVGE